jgi:hypothetical protein
MQHRLVQCAVAPWLLVIPARLAAQVDYRNLDGRRPSMVEDAYPIERHELDWSVQYGVQTGAGTVHSFGPELSWGALRNGSVGLSLDWDPIRSGGAAGPRLRSRAFGFANLAGESPSLPALAVRADVATPLDGGDFGAASLTLTGIVTRSWGMTRLHLNGAWTVASPAEAVGQSEPRWWAGLAVDRTLFRTSTLLIGEVVAERAVGGSGQGWRAGIGLRRQVSPTVVLDAGFALLRGDRDGFAMTIGLSHAFAIAGLMPRGPR